MIQAPGITVNDAWISPEEILVEVQNHPANTLPEAKYRAMQALVVRELLLQRAVRLGLCPEEKELVGSDDLIEKVLEQEIHPSDPDPGECQRYYDNNRRKFYTAPIFEVSHIFYPAPPNDKDLREKARRRAESALEEIRKNPQCFQNIARTESACPSGKTGGFLGQIGKGQTLPSFEGALFSMQEGEISSKPVETDVGFHIILAHRREDGKPLPSAMALERIADHLRKKAWLADFHEYVQGLMAEAKISGFLPESAKSPLIQ